jgi:hypothetical protein
MASRSIRRNGEAEEKDQAQYPKPNEAQVILHVTLPGAISIPTQGSSFPTKAVEMAASMAHPSPHQQ